MIIPKCGECDVPFVSHDWCQGCGAAVCEGEKHTCEPKVYTQQDDPNDD